MNFKITSFFFSVVLLSVLLVTQSQDTYLCSDVFPTRPETCSLAYDPVCANFPIPCYGVGCPTGRFFQSPCLACQDSLVESYALGPCPEPEVAEVEGQPECGEENCWAEEEEYQNWLEGNSNNDWKIYCETNPRNDVGCTREYEPVCGFSVGSNHGTTFSNGCVACYEERVEYFVYGEC